MAEALDSNFFIFLPHVFTSDPVSDIEKGARLSCFVGELLNFFLIAQYRSKGGVQSALQDWQKKLLRIFTSVSVSCVDLAISKDHGISSSGFITCWPVTSSRHQKVARARKVLEPTITSRGDIIFPLQVSLDNLPAMTRKVKLSVNVWTPELNISALSDTQEHSDVVESRFCQDFEEDVTQEQTPFRCHVNASLPIATSPSVQCKYMAVGGRHYLAVEVANGLIEAMAIHHLRVHSTLDVTPLQMRCIDAVVKSSGLDVFPVTLDDTDSQNCYKLLQPWEQNSYIFQIVYHGDRTKHKSLEVALTTSLTWSVNTLQSREQEITTHYSMPVFNIRRSSVNLHAVCPSVVVKGDRLQVEYTITNMEREDCNVFLIWMPSAGGLQNGSAGALICFQPLIRIGYCASGSSHTVHVEFLAVEEGLHEVGKHMFCKQYTDMGKADLLTDAPDPSNMTTVSHPCQVYVVPVR